MTMHHPIATGADAAVTAALVSSPVWAVYLADVNLILTTLTLIVGIGVGVGRLWGLWRESREKGNDP